MFHLFLLSVSLCLGNGMGISCSLSFFVSLLSSHLFTEVLYPVFSLVVS
jgi:hypothetical protein